MVVTFKSSFQRQTFFEENNRCALLALDSFFSNDNLFRSINIYIYVLTVNYLYCTDIIAILLVNQ